MFKVSNLLTWKWTTGLRWQQHEATCKYVDVLRASPGIRSKQPSAAEGSRWPPSTWMFSLDFWKQLYKLEVFTYSTMVRNYVLIQMLLVGFHMFPPFSLSHPSIVFGFEPRLQRPNRYSICWCFSSQKHKYTDVIYDGMDVKGSAYIFDV